MEDLVEMAEVEEVLDHLTQEAIVIKLLAQVLLDLELEEEQEDQVHLVGQAEAEAELDKLVLIPLLQTLVVLAEMVYNILYLEQQYFMQAEAADAVEIWDLQQVVQV
jgi:hypothetical protein